MKLSSLSKSNATSLVGPCTLSSTLLAGRQNKIISSVVWCRRSVHNLLGTLSKPRRQWRRRRGKTKGLMSRTMALSVHYKTLYISQPSSAKQQREITTFCVFKTTRVPTANFSYFYWKMKPAFTYSA